MSGHEDIGKDLEKADRPAVEEAPRSDSEASLANKTGAGHGIPGLVQPTDPSSETKDATEQITTRARCDTVGSQETTSKLSKIKESVKCAYCRFTGAGEHGDPTMTWKGTACLMVAETISLGILSLPSAVKAVGLVPGFLLIDGLGIITILTGYIMHSFFMRHRDQATDFPSAVGLIWGAWGRWSAEVIMWVFFTFLMAGHIVLFRNLWAIELSDPAAICTLVSTAIGAFTMGLMTLPKAFKAISKMSYLSSFSIVSATFAILIDLAINNRGKHIHWLAMTSLGHGFERYSEVFLAVSNICVSYTGHCCWFNIMSEMKEPKEFHKALNWASGVFVFMYTLSGVVLYALAGNAVESPALSSASAIGQKIAYGLAVPTIVVAGVILALTAAKRIQKLTSARFKSLETTSPTKGELVWSCIVVSQWLCAYIIGNGVPFFGSLLGLLGGLCGVPICLVWPAAFWLFDLRHRYQGPAWRRNTINVLVSIMFGTGIVIMGLGLYGSISEIQYLMNEGGTEGWKPFSCALPPGTV